MREWGREVYREREKGRKKWREKERVGLVTVYREHSSDHNMYFLAMKGLMSISMEN